jgi:hypothetical protein
VYRGVKTMSGQSASSSQNMVNIANMLSNGSSNNQFSQNLWGGQQGALSDLYKQAQNLFSGNQGALNKGVNQAVGNTQGVYNSSAPAWNKQLQGGQFSGVNTNALNKSYQDQLLANTSGAANRLSGSLDKSLNTKFTPSGQSNQQSIYASMMGGQGNNYADAMKSQYMQDAQRAQEQMLGNLDARTAGTGTMGSTRQQVAQGMGMRDINSNLQGNLARTGYDTFDKDLQNKLSIAQQADTNNFNRENMYMSDRQNAQNLAAQELAAQRGQIYGAQQGMTGLNQMGQDVRTGALNNSSNMQNLGMGSLVPLNQQWQGLQNYQQALGSPLVLNQGSGSSQNNSSGSSMGKSTGKSRSAGGGI